MPRIAVLDDYQGEALASADWNSLPGCEAVSFREPFDGEDEAAAALAAFDVAVAMRERTPFPASLLIRLPQLKLLITTGMRNAEIDLLAARTRNVDVCGTNILPYPAVELCWALILALIKKIPAEDRVMRAGGWQTGLGEGLNGKILGLLGLGRLGAQVASVGRAFGMEVIAWSQNLTDAHAAEVGVRRVTKDDLFRDADVIAIHLVLGDRTRGLVGKREFDLMKPTSYLVNTSRGPIVDEAALVGALAERRIAGAGIDVYNSEPLPADHPLRHLENAVLTGHVGYVTRENWRLMYAEAVEDIRAWLVGSPVRLLNPPMGNP